MTQTSEVLGKTAAKDLASNKTTYPKLLGIDKSKEVSSCCWCGVLWCGVVLYRQMLCLKYRSELAATVGLDMEMCWCAMHAQAARQHPLSCSTAMLW